MRPLICALLLLLTTSSFAEDGWFPYSFPADPAKAPDYQGMPASVFNAGIDVLLPVKCNRFDYGFKDFGGVDI